MEKRGEMDIDSIIWAPLEAAAKANEALSRQQNQFLLDTCPSDEGGNFRKPAYSPNINSVADIEMIKSQTIPCPVCRTPIPFDMNRILQGESLACPNCQARVTLNNHCKSQAQDAVDRLKKLYTED